MKKQSDGTKQASETRPSAGVGGASMSQVEFTSGVPIMEGAKPVSLFCTAQRLGGRLVIQCGESGPAGSPLSGTSYIPGPAGNAPAPNLRAHSDVDEGLGEQQEDFEDEEFDDESLGDDLTDEELDEAFEGEADEDEAGEGEAGEGEAV